MANFGALFKSMVGQIQHSPRQMPSALRIANDHVDQNQQLRDPFERDEHYFQVRINEMYLADQRRWFNAIDPVVFVVSEFIYDKQAQAVPVIVGPAMMQKFGQKMPQGMLFRNTRVAGLHPYRGGRLMLSVVLCQVTVNQYARQLLNLIETAAHTLDFATAVAPYLKVAGVVADGFEALLGLGDTVPLIALRTEFDPDGNDVFAPGFFALIDAPGVDPKTLWVCDQQLMAGDSMQSCRPYRDNDYVLYSIVRPTDNMRSDVDQLGFNELWERVKKEAAVPKDDNYTSAKANMVSLYQSIVLSPDLTFAQANVLADQYADQMSQIHKHAVRFSNLSADETPGAQSPLDCARSKALDVFSR
jgi:hypothetical protein